MLPPRESIQEQVRRALAEDLGPGDLSAGLIPRKQNVQGRVIAREPAVLCGCAWFEEVFRQLDHSIQIEWRRHDGDSLDADDQACRFSGPARGILSGERTALNFLQLLSGTATAASRYAKAIAGTGARVLDTRKTIPGLRLAQKYAVRCGGATNHRIGLFDAILIKENHIAAAGSIRNAVAQGKRSGKAVEVEVETLEELEQAMAAGADRALIDNFDLEAMRRAVELARGHIELEASGNVSLDAIRGIAETGVDYISVGAITKHVTAVDYSMRFD